VVSDFLRALQSDPSGKSGLASLGQAAQSTLSKADLAASARAADQVSMVSLDLTKVSPDQLVYTANLWVAPDLNQPGDQLVGANTRTFYLTRMPDAWRIAQIAESASQSWL
jgi:hypothetical protein